MRQFIKKIIGALPILQFILESVDKGFDMWESLQAAKGTAKVNPYQKPE